MVAADSRDLHLCSLPHHVSQKTADPSTPHPPDRQKTQVGNDKRACRSGRRSLCGEKFGLGLFFVNHSVPTATQRYLCPSQQTWACKPFVSVVNRAEITFFFQRALPTCICENGRFTITNFTLGSMARH